MTWTDVDSKFDDVIEALLRLSCPDVRARLNLNEALPVHYNVMNFWWHDVGKGIPQIDETPEIIPGEFYLVTEGV